MQGRGFRRHAATMSGLKSGRKKGGSGFELPDPPDIHVTIVALAEITLKTLEIALHQVKPEPRDAGRFIDHGGQPPIIKDLRKVERGIIREHEGPELAGLVQRGRKQVGIS